MDAARLEHVDGGGNGEEGLAGTGGTDAEDELVIADGVEVERRADGAAGNGTQDADVRGVEAGDTVVTAGVRRLQDGMTVRAQAGATE